MYVQMIGRELEEDKELENDLTEKKYKNRVRRTVKVS